MANCNLMNPKIRCQPPASAHKQTATRMKPVVEQAVASIFSVRITDLNLHSRGQAKIALSRQIAMYLFHVNCGASLTDTGRYFGRDRTTVAHACRTVENLRDDWMFDHSLALIERAVLSYSKIGGSQGANG